MDPYSGDGVAENENVLQRFDNYINKLPNGARIEILYTRKNGFPTRLPLRGVFSAPYRGNVWMYGRDRWYFYGDSLTGNIYIEGPNDERIDMKDIDVMTAMENDESPPDYVIRRGKICLQH